MNELLGLVKNIAPSIATALGSPLAGMAVSALAERFGVEDEVEAVTKAIKSDPEAAIKLKQLELDKFKAVLADKDSARNREATIATSEKAPLLRIDGPCAAFSRISCDTLDKHASSGAHWLVQGHRARASR